MLYKNRRKEVVIIIVSNNNNHNNHNSNNVIKNIINCNKMMPVLAKGRSGLYLPSQSGRI